MGQASVSEARVLALGAGRWWWLWLIAGVMWMIVAFVILQFDQASVATVGIIAGCMFMAFGAQQLVMAFATDHLRWLSIVFGVLFAIGGILCFIRPVSTFAGLADMLGFLFLLTGIWWTIEAFLVRSTDSLWWLLLIFGLFTSVIAFWVSGQFFFDKAYILLVLAGAWALVHGAGDIVRAFQARSGR
jgi:uncharacterized membrane protein HdeD (DUF308 family)